MFLEAIRLHALGGNARAIRTLLIDRDEVLTDTPAPPTEEESGDLQLRIASLFHRVRSTSSPGHFLLENIRLGEIGQDSDAVQISFEMLRRVRQEGTSPSYRYELVGSDSDSMSESNLSPGLAVEYRGISRLIPFQTISAARSRSFYRSDDGGEPAFVPAKGVSERELARWWDLVAMRNCEDRVIDCLKLISPVERITFVEYPLSRADRMPIVRLQTDPFPIPLKSLGDGMTRIFQIALAIERSQAGRRDQPDLLSLIEESPPVRTPLLLIDEIENGIHYSVHAKLWGVLLRLAAENDIQVFATSHSWDCICGLKEAVAANPAVNTVLIRLEKKDGKDKAIIFQKDELDVIARDEIEVR
jgi:hypothetical protein